jgi:succinate dehydrogenase flavin-adding protein (antitoxin of CptAB toxin-antitoxin module)
MANPFDQNTMEAWRKRLLYQSQHRGTKELDLLLGPLACRHLSHWNEEILAHYELFLNQEEHLLWQWIQHPETCRMPDHAGHSGHNPDDRRTRPPHLLNDEGEKITPAHIQSFQMFLRMIASMERLI